MEVDAASGQVSNSLEAQRGPFAIVYPTCTHYHPCRHPFPDFGLTHLPQGTYRITVSTMAAVALAVVSAAEAPLSLGDLSQRIGTDEEVSEG